MLELLNFDQKRLSNGGIIGLDEAGRGALAGPVSVGAVYLDPNAYEYLSHQEFTKDIKDSKLLSARKREELYEIITNLSEVKYCLCLSSVEEIEQLNITGAIARAMNSCVTSLLKEISEVFHPQVFGGLELFYNPEALKVFTDGKPFKGLEYPHEAYVGGDCQSLAIAMASVIAKVGRDRVMLEIDQQYPQYKLGIHKGYGTRVHREAIKEYGASKWHRKQFIRNIVCDL